MARDTGDESSEDEGTAELTTLEMDFFKKFKERAQEANEVVNDWLAASKNYESATRITLFEQYRVMEEKIIEILNQNKKDSKDQSGPVREKMQERRGWIRDMWQKERDNYHQLDLVIQLKVDSQQVEELFKATAHEQKSNMDFLEISKTRAGVVEGEERSAQEVRNTAFLDKDGERLEEEFQEVASCLDKFAKVKLPPKDAFELAEGFKIEFQTLTNQINSLSWNCQHVSFESEFDRYRHEMDRRMKLMSQYADSNRAVVELYPKKTVATAKGGITMTLKKCQRVLDNIDEWKDTGLKVAMLSNRKNHTSLKIALAKDERRSKDYEDLTAEYNKGKALEKAMRKKPAPISINLSVVYWYIPVMYAT
jgi:hypothetical protein